MIKKVEMSVAGRLFSNNSNANNRPAKISEGRKNTITTRRRSPNASDLTRKTKCYQESSKTRRISIKESLDKALVQLGSDGDKVNKYYSSGEYVVDCSKLEDLNNERQTSKRRVPAE
jgi:hypothetical protein